VLIFVFLKRVMVFLITEIPFFTILLGLQSWHRPRLRPRLRLVPVYAKGSQADTTVRFALELINSSIKTIRTMFKVLVLCFRK
jgi:hypothetical protein